MYNIIVYWMYYFWAIMCIGDNKMKQYSKPEIMFESFELAENIAMCELIASEHARYSCAVIDPESGWTIFSTDSCSQTPADGEQICYEVPFEDYNVFVS